MNKELRIKEIVNIELDGISRVIREYSTDQFITSYAEKLCKNEFKDNPIYLKSLVERIKAWYEMNNESIQKSQYTQHKELHKKSFQIITELYELMKD
jgi:hypothetical protein